MPSVLPLRFRMAAPSVPLVDHFSQIINVKESPYYAQGDGIADDGPAIQAALDAALGGKTTCYQHQGVFIPSGTYNIGATLNVTPSGAGGDFPFGGAYIFGAGQRNTVLRYTGALDTSSVFVTFNGSISGTTLTVNSISSGLMRTGLFLIGAGIAAGTKVVAQLSSVGGIGNTGTYSISISHGSIGPETISGYITWLFTTHQTEKAFFQGFTLDCTGSNANIAFRVRPWLTGNNGGTGVTYVDMGIKGPAFSGWLGDSPSEGSEQFFLNCTFDGCGPPTGSGLLNSDGAMLVASDNALDISMVGCVFKNGSKAISCPFGGVELVRGCTFLNNGDADIWVREQNATSIVSCYSNSINFVAGGGPFCIQGCMHDPPSAGYFVTNSLYGLDLPCSIVDGCFGGVNSTFNTSSGYYLYLRGNTFLNPAYKTNALFVQEDI